ncbi:MAG: thioredoxin-dependent thiol peroxidase [Chloroflexi bacterium]|nr:thioredoxin-dependent thiol peroxidase [Chloroflexota bacterium]
MPAIGQPMPEFSLVNQDGKTISLRDLRGKKVVLFAFPRADTPGCTTQACGFRDNFANILTKNATVLGISADSPEDLKKWQQQEGLQYDLLSDPDHTLLEALGAWGEKSMYGKTYLGIIRSHWVFDENGSIIDEQIKISPEDSVRKAYQTLG